MYKLVDSGLSKLQNNIEWKFLPPTLGDIRIAKGEMDIRVLVSNKNRFSTVVNAFEGTAHMASREIATIKSLADIEIPAGAAKELKLTFAGVDEDAFFALSNIFSGNNRRALTIKGRATIKGNSNQWVKVPVSYTHYF